MAWTQTQLDALEDAIAKGVTLVKYKDKEVRYRTLKDMLELRNKMRECLGLSEKGGGRLKVSTSKGLC